MVIAVAFDDTPEGRWAAVYAARAAMQRREQLLVLRIVDDASSTEPDSVRVAVQAALDAGGVGESPWELQTAEHSGDRVGALIDLIDDSGAALFVAGSRRKNAVGKFLLDRALQRLLLEVEVPVLVVKEPLDDD